MVGVVFPALNLYSFLLFYCFFSIVSTLFLRSPYEKGRKIATLPSGIIKTIPSQLLSPYYDIAFLSSLKRYLLYSSIIYTRIIPHKLPFSKTQGCCRNIFSGMKGSFEGIRINYYYLYGTRITEKGEKHVNGIEGIDFYAHNGTTVLRSEQIEDSELVYLSQTANILHKPYGIFLDHKEEKIVIAIRGTYSLEDCFTDLDCEATEMNIIGEKWGFNGKGRWAHSGCLKVASGIREEIEQLGLLDKILGRTEDIDNTLIHGDVLKKPINAVSSSPIMTFLFLNVDFLYFVFLLRL
jgi:energy-converting hydrogenase Eha subunit C